MKHTVPLPLIIKIFTITLIFALSVFFVDSNSSYANDWEASIYKSALPQKVVAVDKSNQLFHFFEENSPSAKFTFMCTTGQIDGAKQVENDLKTPEGIYFVQYKISDGLDFAEYGGIAYTLNYPNPVDKLQGKTGYGIWIHSKGLGIKPKDTRGCIAIGLDELATVGPKLSYGTAVLLAETIKINDSPKASLGVATALIAKMDEWTKAWEARSTTMFSMYNQDSYSKAMPESFSAFKANKVNLFSILPWITIYNRKIYVLEGPGYWVTWSEQFYRAPNLSTEGIRRLYWQLDDNDEYKIVGMEWLPRNLGMKADYLKGKLVTSTLVADSATSKSDIKTSEEPVHPAIDMPEKGELEQIKATAASTETSDSDKVIVDEQIKALLQNNMSTWLNDWQNKSNKFFEHYDQANFGSITNARDKNGTEKRHNSFVQLKQYMQNYFTAKWIEITAKPITVASVGNALYTESELFIRAIEQIPVQGILRLYWKKSDNGEYLIVDSSWQEKNVNMEIYYFEKITPIIYAMISDWQKAWLSADVDEYSSFYANDAIQQNLEGKTNIANHKSRIWKTSKPKEIKLTGIRLSLDTTGLIVDMTQYYADTKEYTDVGTKILLLQPTANGYLILNEKWKPID